MLNNWIINILSNIQLFTLLAFLNGKYNSDQNIINSVGSINTLLNILLYPVLYGFSTVIEIRGSLAYGASKKKLLSNVIHRARVMGLITLLIVMTLLMILHTYIFQLMKYNAKLSEYIFKILYLRLIAVLFEFEFNIMFRTVMIVGRGLDGMLILAAHAGMSILYPFLIIKYLNLGIYSVGLSYICINSTSCLIIWGYILVFQQIDTKILSLRKNVWTSLKIWDTLKYSLILCSLSLLDSMDNETMSIMASFLDSTSFSAYNIVYSTAIITSGVGQSFYLTTNLVISFVCGEKNYEKLKVYFRYLLYSGIIISLTFILVLSFMRDTIISIIVNSVSIGEIAKRLYPFIMLTIFLETMGNILRNTVKSLGKIYLIFFAILFLVSSNIVFIYCYTFTFKFGVYGVYYGYITYLGLAIIISSTILIFIDWKEAINDSNVSLIEIKENKEN